MEWKNAPISRASAIQGAMDLTLEELVLLAGLWKLTHKNPSKIFCWAYFESSFGLSVSKARTRLARLERAGLVLRSMLGSRPSDALGSRIDVTPMGKDLLRILAPILRSEPVGQGRAGAGAAEAVIAPAAVKAPAAPGVFADYPIVFQQAVLKLGIGAARAVKAAIERGGSLSDADLADTPLPPGAAAQLNEAMRRYAPSNTAAPLVVGSNGGETETLVPAAHDDAIRIAIDAGAAIPAISACAPDAVRPIADLVRVEISARYRSLACGTRATSAVKQLDELVWSCTQGPLADFGAPIKRVRVGLKLMALGRWETPIGYVPSASTAVFDRGLRALRN